MPIRSRIVAFLGGREALERKGDRLEQRGREGDQEQEGEPKKETARRICGPKWKRMRPVMMTSNELRIGKFSAPRSPSRTFPLPVRSAANTTSVPRGTGALNVIGRGERCKTSRPRTTSVPKGRCDRSLLLLNEAGSYVQNISAP